MAFKKGHKTNVGRIGKNSTHWKDGISYDKQGYKLIHCTEHPNARNGKYMLEHRLVMEKIIGRYLFDTEIVHHKNKDILDNQPENLEIVSRSEHSSIHIARDPITGRFI